MTGGPPASRHPLLVRVLSVAIGVAAGVLLFALGYEALERWRAAAPPAPGASDTGADATGAMLRPATESAYQPSPWFVRLAGRSLNLRAQLVPFSAGQQGRHNSHGFRTVEYTTAHPPDTFRIVALGDSFTWGDGIAAEETYHRQLQQIFDGEQAAGTPRVEVIGLGTNGSSFFDNLIRLRAHAAGLAPDLVLVQFFMNDLEYRSYPFLLQDVDDGALRAFVEATAVGRALLERVPDLERRRVLDAELERQYEADSLEWQLFLHALDAYAEWRRESGVPVVFLSFPDIDLRPDGRNYDHYRAYRRNPGVTRAEAEIERRGFPTLRLEETFRARAGDRYLAIAPRNGHYNALANRLVAEGIREFLRGADAPRVDAPRRPDGDPRFAAEHPLRERAAREWQDLHQSYARQSELFEALLAVLPDDAWLVQNDAWVARQRQDCARSRALLDRLPALAPERVAPWFDLALCSDDPAEREALLVRMLEQVPDHAAAVEDLALLDARAGRRERACGCYRRLAALSLYPAQLERALDALREQRCDGGVAETCPGVDPLAPL